MALEAKTASALVPGATFGPAGKVQTGAVRVRLQRAIRIEGKHINAETVLTLPRMLAMELIGSNKAVREPEPVSKSKADAPAA